MDGPGFHNARDALEVAKREKRWASVLGFGDDRDRIVNGVLRSLETVRGGWTRRQREAVAVRGSMALQKEAAELMGLDQSTLGKMLQAARYRPYREVERAMMELLKVFWNEGGDRCKPSLPFSLLMDHTSHA